MIPASPAVLWKMATPKRYTDEATLDAVERARRGEGPTFIEAMTYRLVGHMIGDNEVYRTKAEVAEWRERDMIVGVLLESLVAHRRHQSA